MAVIKTKLNTKFSIVASASKFENKGPHHLPNAAITALNIRDTIIKNPIPSIIPKDSSRARINCHTQPVLSLSGTRQIRSKASCNSPNTVVAPINNSTVPIIVPAIPSLGSLTLSSKPCTA